MSADDGPMDDLRIQHEPWHVVWSSEGTWPGQAELKAALTARIGARFGERSYLAPSAAVIADELRLGDRSYIAAGCQIRDRLRIGDDSTLNPHVTTAGLVTIGDGVRIASHVALYGFSHVADDPDVPIWMQGLVEAGVRVEDDVWIGTHAVVCDGVTVGAHSVIAAGAVVVHDVPPYSVVAGVPARVVRDRRDPRRNASASRRTLDAFDDTVRAQWPDVVARCRLGIDPVEGFADRPGAPSTSRTNCDAIEIAAAFGDWEPVGGRAAWIERLRAQQDAVTGMFMEPGEDRPDSVLAWSFDGEDLRYRVLSVGYALEVLGSSPRDPVRVVDELADAQLLLLLDALPWATLAWPAGAWVDFFATASYLNRRHHGSRRGLEAIFGWLQTRCDRHSGLWGPPDDTWGWLMPVNGAYRLARGTYAQFGEPIPAPDAAIDTVLRHARDHRWFVERHHNACNVLDVVHLLWLAGRQTAYRRAEVRECAAALRDDTLRRWIDGRGFAFSEADGSDGDAGLQGTEMWLSVVFLLADILGESDGLSWRPRGVHRLEPGASASVPLA